MLRSLGEGQGEGVREREDMSLTSVQLFLPSLEEVSEGSDVQANKTW